MITASGRLRSWPWPGPAWERGWQGFAWEAPVSGRPGLEVRTGPAGEPGSPELELHYSLWSPGLSPLSYSGVGGVPVGVETHHLRLYMISCLSSPSVLLTGLGSPKTNQSSVLSCLSDNDSNSPSVCSAGSADQLGWKQTGHCPPVWPSPH